MYSDLAAPESSQNELLLPATAGLQSPLRRRQPLLNADVITSCTSTDTVQSRRIPSSSVTTQCCRLTDASSSTGVSSSATESSVLSRVSSSTPVPLSAVALKSVLVGDSGVGKTALVVSYTTNGFPSHHQPTTFDNYSVTVMVDNRPVILQLCDTPGERDNKLDKLRSVWYLDAHIFLLCFSVVQPRSLQSLQHRWLPQLRRQLAARVTVVLVGTQCDLRSDVQVLIELSKLKQQPVSESEARKFAAQHRLDGYVECSALTQCHLKDVFDRSIISALKHSVKQTPPPPPMPGASPPPPSSLDNSIDCSDDVTGAISENVKSSRARRLFCCCCR